MQVKGIVCGIGSTNIPKTGDPDNNILLSAVSEFGGIALSWTYPLTNAHAVAHIEIYRNTLNNPDNAVRIAVVNTDHYFDELPTGATYFYWIKIISVQGTVGKFSNVASASPKPILEKYLETLSGQLDETVLGQSLQEKIAAIQDVKDGINEVRQYAQDEYRGLASAVQSLQTTVDESVATIQQESNVRAEENNAIAQDIRTVQTKLGNDIASVQVETVTNIKKVTDKVTVLESKYTVKVDANGLVGGFGLSNDSKTIDAAFNVDRFWVGRANTKIKPFIIEGNTVYINQAYIKDLTFTKLKDTKGSLIVNNGKIKADYLEAKKVVANQIEIPRLSDITANMGHLNQGSLNIANRFIVDNNGNVTIRSNTQGPRVTITSRLMEVHDGRFTRVRIGLW